MDIKALLADVARREEALGAAPFLAPVVRQGGIRASVSGMVRTLCTDPAEHEGWGIWQAKRHDSGTMYAHLEESAPLYMVEEYLELMPSLRLWLVRPLSGRSWLALPANLSDMAQRFGEAHPIVVHLVYEGRRFDRIVARFDGGAWWAHELDARANPFTAESLRVSLEHRVAPERAKVLEMTPEHLEAYRMALAHQREEERRAEQRARRRAEREERRAHEERVAKLGSTVGRVADALERSGASLEEIDERDGYLWVQWRSPSGGIHYSSIATEDLTVISSGICLSGEDRKFDMQSLVGVIEGAGW